MLVGTIPSNIVSLKLLRVLYLNNNTLSGTLPPGLGNLQGLTYLILSDNQLTGPIPEYCTDGDVKSCFPELSILGLGNNLLSVSIPAYIFQLPKLEIFVSILILLLLVLSAMLLL